MSAEQAKTPKLPKDPTQDAAPETSGTGGTVTPTNIYNESTRQ
jgi:hypothetical protein